MYVVTRLMWGVFNFSICLPAHWNGSTYPFKLIYLPRISSYSTGNYCCSPSSVNACLSRPKKETLVEFLGISLCVTLNISFPFQILPLLRDKIWNGKPGFEASRCAHETNRR